MFPTIGDDFVAYQTTILVKHMASSTLLINTQIQNQVWNKYIITSFLWGKVAG